jgi:hypothetical protein
MQHWQSLGIPYLACQVSVDVEKNMGSGSGEPHPIFLSSHRSAAMPHRFFLYWQAGYPASSGDGLSHETQVRHPLLEARHRHPWQRISVAAISQDHIGCDGRSQCWRSHLADQR